MVVVVLGVVVVVVVGGGLVVFLKISSGSSLGMRDRAGLSDTLNPSFPAVYLTSTSLPKSVHRRMLRSYGIRTSASIAKNQIYC